jgi:hypothetical protein
MNDPEVTEPIRYSLFEEPKAHWWIAKGETPKYRVNAVNLAGGLGVEEFAIAVNITDAVGLTSAA